MQQDNIEDISIKDPITNKDAFNRVYSEDKLFRNYLRKRVPEHIEIDDIMQTFYVKVLENIEKIPTQSYVDRTKYCRFMLRNIMIDYFRAANKQSEILMKEIKEEGSIFNLLDNLPAKHVVLYPKTLEIEDLRECFNDTYEDCVLETFEEFKEDYQKIILLRYIGNYQYKEIAEELQIEQHSVRRILHTFKQRLLETDCDTE